MEELAQLNRSKALLQVQCCFHLQRFLAKPPFNKETRGCGRSWFGGPVCSKAHAKLLCHVFFNDMESSPTCVDRSRESDMERSKLA